MSVVVGWANVQTNGLSNLNNEYLFNGNVCFASGAFSNIFIGNIFGNSTKKVAIKFLELNVAPSNTNYHNVVSLITKPSGFDLLLKPKVKSFEKYVINEIECLKRLKNHEQFINLHNVFMYNNCFFLVMDLFPGKSLVDIFLEREQVFSAEITKILFEKMCNAMVYCHKNKIAHRDFKLDNILLNEETLQIKIIDFGLSELDKDQDSLCTSFSGTILYSAPEVLRGKPFNPYLADIWSLGISLYCLIYAEFPWFSENENVLIKMILSGSKLPPKKIGISNLFTLLINGLLEPELEKRMKLENALSLCNE